MGKLSDLQGLDQIPVLGSGVGYREPWFGSLTSIEGNGIDFLEITADHFMDAPSWKTDQLKKLKESCWYKWKFFKLIRSQYIFIINYDISKFF